MSTAQCHTRKPLAILATRTVVLLTLTTLFYAMACADQDAAIKQIIADYYNLDVSKVGDKPIAPACGRMAIENGWDTDPELTRRYRFMFPSSAEAESHRVATRAIITVTGDDAQEYCEAKLKRAHEILPTLPPPPTWRVQSTSVWSKGTLPENAISPIQTENNLRSEIEIGCFRGRVEAIFAFVRSRAGDAFIPGDFKYSIDDGPPTPLAVEETNPTTSVRAESPTAIIAALRQGEKLVITAPRYNHGAPPGPDLRAEFDLVGLDQAINEVTCLTEQLRSPTTSVLQPTHSPKPASNATLAAKPADFPTPTMVPRPTTPPASATLTPNAYSIRPGSSIELPSNWSLVAEHADCLAFDRNDNLSNAALCAFPLPANTENSEQALKLFAQDRRDRMHRSTEDGEIADFKPISLLPTEIDGKMYERLHYSFQLNDQSCSEDRVMLFTFHEDSEGLYGISLRVGICTADGSPDETERLTIFNSFEP